MKLKILFIAGLFIASLAIAAPVQARHAASSGGTWVSLQVTPSGSAGNWTLNFESVLFSGSSSAIKNKTYVRGECDSVPFESKMTWSNPVDAFGAAFVGDCSSYSAQVFAGTDAISPPVTGSLT